MDAKPQRPLRTLRVRDENLPPTSIAPSTKLIHQRNKSTPALSTLMQAGGVKAATKRTAFADVSNTVRTVQQAKDDMILPGKGKLEIQKDNSVISTQTQGIVKPVALLRPAQRPLPAPVPKAAVTAAAAAIASAVSKSVAVESEVQTANIRKVLSKRATTVFREPTVPVVEEIPSVTTTDDTRPAASTALVHQSLAPLQEKTVELLREELREEQNDAVAAAKSEKKVEHVVPSSNDINPIPEKVRVVEKVEVRHESLEAQSTAVISTQYKVVPVDSREDNNQYLQTLEQQARALERERSEELVRHSAVMPVLEVEEYWDEEEEEEYYDADGYTTARSLRTRSDNTTGGVTIVLAPRVTAKVERELAAARDYVERTKTPEDVEDEAWDTSMVAEYGDEIFLYMRDLEERMRPNPYYMDNQAEIQWSMRSVLMDWLVQVHHRFTLLPETLFLSVNYVDRFLSCKIVSLGKLQLVGATAIFVAAKYEEINCPSVQEIVYMVDGGYTVDEILKAERFMLSMLQFELGWPGPMSFLRRISKADDYDLETRTLAKYFLEITVMDERFVGCTPSFTAAGAHCLARLMLRKGDWSQAHVHYSQYTYPQLHHLVSVILECCENPMKHHQAVYEKYADKRYKRASLYVESELHKGFQLPPVSRESTASYSQSWRRK